MDSKTARGIQIAVNIAFGFFALFRLLSSPTNTSAANMKPRIRAPYYAVIPEVEQLSPSALADYKRTYPAYRSLNITDMRALKDSMKGTVVSTLGILQHIDVSNAEDYKLIVHGVRTRDGKLLPLTAICRFKQRTWQELMARGAATNEFITVTGRYTGKVGNSVVMDDCSFT